MARRKASQAATNNKAAANGAETYAAVKPPLTRTEYVQSVLRAEILSGRLSPGTPILQDEVGARLGVSITPVREALRKLESAGLVSYETHYGATVAQLKAEEVEELYLLRAVVEGLAARLASTSITETELAELRTVHQEMVTAAESRDVAGLAEGSRRFHQVIATAGGRTVVARHLQQIWEAHPVPVEESIWANPRVAQEALDFHERLLTAIERGDSALAESLMVEHVQLALGERMHSA